MDNATPNPQPATTGDLRVVTLDVPLKRGTETIGFIQLRKPAAGELRGLNLLALSQLDVMALRTLLPRITDPMLTPQEIDALDLADLMQLGGEIMDFLLPRAAKPASLAQ